jgi:AcrR family transcriptional regulator
MSESNNVTAKRTRGPNLKKRQRTRNKLIDATKSLLLTKPADEITINDITSSADCALGTFYNYFLSKTLIMDAVMNDLIESLLEEVKSDFDNTGVTHPIDRLSVGFRLVSLNITSKSDLGFLLFESGLPLKNLMFNLESFIESEIDAGIEERLITVAEPSLVATLTAGSLMNMLMKQYSGFYGPDMIDMILQPFIQSDLVTVHN